MKRWLVTACVAARRLRRESDGSSGRSPARSNLHGHRFSVELATEQRRPGARLDDAYHAGRGPRHAVRFQRTRSRSAFWMKNTLIPLDILYFDNDRQAGIDSTRRSAVQGRPLPDLSQRRCCPSMFWSCRQAQPGRHRCAEPATSCRSTRSIGTVSPWSDRHGLTESSMPTLIGNQVFRPQGFQHVPVVFERNELLHGDAPLMRAHASCAGTSEQTARPMRWRNRAVCGQRKALTQSISIISKSSLVVPQSGQVQVSGTSSQRVPAAMPSSGTPTASS